MMILLTGSSGRIGVAARRALEEAGLQVRPFDLDEGCDVRDAASLQRAASGAQVIVHAAGLADDRGGAPADIMAINLLGTWNVLLAAEHHGIARVVFFSSGKALGMLERNPDYLPMDDAHRGLPTRPYGLSKWLAEEMCAAFTARTGIDTLCLRPVAVFDEAGYARAMSTPPQARSPGGIWHLGVHIDLRDVAAATLAALKTPFRGHARLLLCGEDIADTRPTLERVAERLPGIPWRGGVEFNQDPYRSLIDTREAERLLGFRARHRWPGRTESISS